MFTKLALVAQLGKIAASSEKVSTSAIDAVKKHMNFRNSHNVFVPIFIFDEGERTIPFKWPRI